MPPTPNPNTPSSPEPYPLPSPERPNLPVPERSPAPAAPEQATNTPAGAPPQLPPPPPAPAAPPATSPPAAGPTAVGPNPAVANDVDVIEKEWVEQANKIIATTKNDPYTEEEAEEALQQDYLKKRYGHDVKKPDAT